MSSTKKILLGLLILVIYLQGQSQSFHAGALVVDLNVGLEGYNVKYHSKNNATHSDTSIKGGAINHNFSLGIEYGIVKRLGVGLRGKSNVFFTEVDKLTNIRPNVKSSEFVLFVNFHAIVKRHFDLIIGSDVGLSVFNYKTNDSANIVLKGTGSYFDLYVNPRFYIGRFGFNVKAFVPFVNYSNLKTNNALYNEYLVTNWKGNGFGMSAGIQFRFFK